MIKAFIFDMDGVIIDSEPSHIQSEIELMKRYGVHLEQKDLEIYTGQTAKFMFEDLSKKHNLKTDWQSLNEEKEQLFIPLLKKAEAIPGVLSFVMFLKNKGYKLALASSSKKNLIKIVLQNLQLEEIFKVAISGEDVTHCKPDPEIFLKAAEMLHVKPEECCVVEDAENGVKAAKRAGMKCIGFSAPGMNQDLSKADQVIKDFSKLITAQ